MNEEKPNLDTIIAETLELQRIDEEAKKRSELNRNSVKSAELQFQNVREDVKIKRVERIRKNKQNAKQMLRNEDANNTKG